MTFAYDSPADESVFPYVTFPATMVPGKARRAAQTDARGEGKNSPVKFVACTIAGAWLVEPTPHEDERGRFMRAWCHKEFADHGIAFVPVQANMGFSRLKGTLRGLHYQRAPALEAKLVRCTRGSMFDVVVDLRRDSTTYRAWYGTCLSADNGRMLLIPEGCAHGCQALEDGTEYHYMSSAMYSPDHAQGARHDDPAFGIAWPLPVSAISAQDRSWPLQDLGEEAVK